MRELTSTPYVCLIIPPSPFLLDQRVFPSLGILKIASVLENNKIKFKILDLSGISNFENAIWNYIRNKGFTMFGITVTTPQLPFAVKIADIIKKAQPNAKIILGGPHVTLINTSSKNSSRAKNSWTGLKKMFDVLVTGDGEKAILEAIKPKAPKIIDADDRHSIFFLNEKELNSLGFPARHLIDLDSYHYKIEGRKSTSLITQLGCPFGCNFCGGRKCDSLRILRSRTPKNITEEMTSLYNLYGIEGFMFYDDELNINENKIIELLQIITEKQKILNIDWRLRGFIRASLFTEKQAQAMFSAGFRWILVGFESGSQRMLDNMGKKTTVRKNTTCLEIAKKAGLKVKALMSIGHPGENKQTIQETKKWLLENKPDDFDITIITVYPGTTYYDTATKTPSGSWVFTHPKTKDKLFQIEPDFLTDIVNYKGVPNKDGGYKSFIFTKELTQQEIVIIRDNLEKEIREKLNIPFNPSSSSVLFEHSMGQQN